MAFECDVLAHSGGWRNGVRSIDAAALDAAWNNWWSASAPAARVLRDRFPGRWVRFHTLPGAKRYATSEAERVEVLCRYRVLLEASLGDVGASSELLVVITCSWSSTATPTPRDEAVSEVTPGAIHWRSDDLATEPGFHAWQHHYVSGLAKNDPALDRLLRYVANDLVDGIVLTDLTCTRIFCPYDGGVDIFTSSAEERDRLSAAYAAWLPPA
jgi:hypothetical protein